MTESMKAAIVYKKGDVRVEKVNVPEIKDNEVLVKIIYAALCPSDMRYYLGSKNVENPMILGHEASGEIVKIGHNIKKFHIGDKVVVNSDYKCGKCYFCKKGFQNFCQDQIVSNGCFAQYKAVPEENLYLIPENTTLLEASCTEPLACVLNGSTRANIKLGSTVAIIGAGPIGLLHIQLAKIKGASRIIVFEPIDFRRNKALELGATEAYFVLNDEVLSYIDKSTNGLLCSSVTVTVGIPSVMESAVNLVGNNGTLLYFAGVHPPKSIGIDPNLIHYRQITITGSSDYPLEFFETSLNLISTNQIKIKPMISDIFSIDDAKDAFENIVDQKALKTVIKMFD